MLQYFSHIGITNVIGAENNITFTASANSPNVTLTGGGILTLPRNKPTDPQLTYTVASNWFPTITQVSGNAPALVKYLAALVIGGVNNGAGTLTFNAEITHTRGGVSHTFDAIAESILTSTKTFALNFRMLVNDYAPVAGDVITVKMWCSESATDMQVSKHAFRIVSTQLYPVNDSTKVLKNVYYKFTNSSAPSGWTVNYTPQKYYKKLTKTGDVALPSSATVFDIDREHADGVAKQELATTPVNITLQHASQYQYASIWACEQLKWSETNIKVIA